MKLDRTAFRIISFEEKGKNRGYWLNKSGLEKLSAAWYLICSAYNISYSADHKLDRTVFKMRKRESEQ